MGSPVPPVIDKIYIEYYEETALGPQYPYLPLGGKDL